MPFKPPKHKTVPVTLPTLVTLVFTAHISNHEAVVTAVRAVLEGRGISDEDTLARIDDGSGYADMGKCIEALMEQSITALAGATGASIGAVDTYVEVPPSPDNLSGGLISNTY